MRIREGKSKAIMYRATCEVLINVEIFDEGSHKCFSQLNKL